MTPGYVHGYDRAESERLQDQAATLAELLHAGTSYPAGHTVLEAGCGVGAQTVTLARHSPRASIIALDISASSLARARSAVRDAGAANVQFLQGDVFHLPFAPHTFDHVFVCFLLEHVARPLQALRALQRALKPGGSITVIEGDHGSTSFHPDSAAARKAVQCLVELQARAGGDALIGRTLFPLLTDVGFSGVHVSPRMVYVDGSRPHLVEGFTRRTFTAMVRGVRASALASGLATAAEFDQGIADLERTAQPDGVFCYTFFKAVAARGT